MAHGLHRVSEQVRLYYPDIDRLVSNIKKVFSKAPSRVSKFREILPDVRLPPQPIITRWGTWLDAVVYLATYIEHLEIILIISFDEDHAISIKISKTIIAKSTTKSDLAFISTNFGF